MINCCTVNPLIVPEEERVPPIYPYPDRVSYVRPSNLIAHWPLNEKSGSVANNFRGNPNKDGTYIGAVLNDNTFISGAPVPLFVPATPSRANVYSLNLSNDFNGSRGSLMVWFKPKDSSIWLDGTTRYICSFEADGNNRVSFFKGDGNYILSNYYGAGGTFKYISRYTGYVNWMQMVMTWDSDADEMKIYFNGKKIGSTQHGLGVWVGSLSSSYCIIGARTVGGLYPWDGWVSNVALWNLALESDEINYLYISDFGNGLFIIGDSKSTISNSWPDLLVSALATATGSVYLEKPTIWTIVTERFISTSSAIFYRSGILAATCDPKNGQAASSYDLANDLTIGSASGGGSTGDFYIAEMLRWNIAMTNAQINQVGHYLKSKWGLSWTNL